MKNRFLSFCLILGGAALVAAGNAGAQAGPSAAPAAAPASTAAVSAAASAPAAPSPLLLAPEKATLKAPDVFRVSFSTTKGDFLVEVRRDWAPAGADRFYNLVKMGFFDGAPFFRAIDGFMVQFGINGDPKVNAKWRAAMIRDDPAAGHSNKRGTMSFATGGPNTRTTQVFINYGDNSRLDSMGFTPIGDVAGMSVVDSLYKGYGEGAPSGAGPDQGRLQREGDAYTKKEFPLMDYVKTATIQEAP